MLLVILLSDNIALVSAFKITVVSWYGIYCLFLAQLIYGFVHSRRRSLAIHAELVTFWGHIVTL